MSKKDKHAKLVARRAKVAAKQRRSDVARQFPRFVIEPGEAPQEFVDAIHRETNAIDFRDTNAFLPWETEVYRNIKKFGAYAATRDLFNNDRLGHHFSVNLGQTLFQRLGKPFLLRFIPFHDVLLTPTRSFIKVTFRSLKQAKGPGGTVYYSRFEPKVEVKGRQLTVAFSGHAIQRTVERLTYDWPTYNWLGQVFSYFDRCLEFELCTLHPDSIGFTFFHECDHGGFSAGIAKHVLGDKFVPTEDYSFRVGYCPAVIEGDFLKAKTLLYPGFAATPEYSKLLAAKMSREERRATVELTKKLSYKYIADNDDGMDLIKWFHKLGVPQIREGKVRYAHSSR